MVKRIVASAMLLLSLSVISNTALAFNIYRVGDVVRGREYNDMLKMWIDRDFSIWVGVGDNNREYIFFEGETGLRSAAVMVENTKSIRGKLEKALSKAIEWSVVAKKKKPIHQKG
jgi:hypothetical protein